MKHTNQKNQFTFFGMPEAEEKPWYCKKYCKQIHRLREIWRVKYTGLEQIDNSLSADVTPKLNESKGS